MYSLGCASKVTRVNARFAACTSEGRSPRRSLPSYPICVVGAIDLNRPGGSGEPPLPFQRRWLRTL